MAEIRLDCLGEGCPIPLVKAQKRLATMKVGEVLILEVDHSCAMKNVPDWAKKAGHKVELNEVDDGLWIIRLEKTK